MNDELKVPKDDAAAIKREVQRRGIRRLCHFTRIENLLSIGDVGSIASRIELKRLGVPCQPNDTYRFDGCRGDVSCTIQYPNAWLLRDFGRKFERATWLVLIIAPDPIWNRKSRFSPVNAATGKGDRVGAGIDSFHGLFRDRPTDLPERPWGIRGQRHLSSCPTDNQAEVLVPRAIDVTLVRGLVVGSRRDGLDCNERRELQRGPLADVPIYCARQFFDPNSLATRIWRGQEIHFGSGEA